MSKCEQCGQPGETYVGEVVFLYRKDGSAILEFWCEWCLKKNMAEGALR